MTFLDHTYFQGEEYLSDLQASPNAVGVAAFIQVAGEQNLNWFIAKYEPEFLVKVLGLELYNDFSEGMQEETPDKRWINLKDSLYWSVNGYKFSPAANYVYYWAKRAGRTQTTMKGEVIGELDYASTAEDADKLIKAWNDMCDLLIRFRYFLQENRDSFEGYRHCYCYHSEFQKINKFGI